MWVLLCFTARFHRLAVRDKVVLTCDARASCGKGGQPPLGWLSQARCELEGAFCLGGLIRWEPVTIVCG